MTDPYAWHFVSDLIETARKHAMPREPGTLGWKPVTPKPKSSPASMKPSSV